MIVARTVADCRAAREVARGPVGFVPTMGYLHEGHLSLVEAARRDCATVAASIFVNPTQFGPNEDFAAYPRDEARDLAMLEQSGVDLVLVPSVEEIYPAGDATRVRVEGVTDPLEGAHRPGHFEGVTTVVARLFNIVQPDRAYFGEKDAQQLAVIRRMTADMLWSIAIVGCPTAREPDGLARSSRNVRLSADERAQAPALHRGLRAACELFADGVRDADALRRAARTPIEGAPLATIDYVSLADAETLAELDGTVGAPALLSMAVRFPGARLIDNVTLRP